MIRTRFAPSPTGDLHVGGAWTALASWLVARAVAPPDEGRVILRVEDLDPPREAPGAAGRILADLAWLGLDWDEGPLFQSARGELYKRAIADLTAKGRVYPCDCSRSEIKNQSIARIASAPHAGEEAGEIVYPGTCRNAPRDRNMKRPPALRFDVGDLVIAFDDEVQGPVTQNLANDVGDFVLRRGDGLFSYQLAVVVDDLAMNVTHVVRGADLLPSTPRQIALARALAPSRPDFTYLHVALVMDAEGGRLAKRSNGQMVSELRARGMSPEAVLGELAFGLGMTASNGPRSARDLPREIREASTGPLGRRRFRPQPFPTPFAAR